MFDDPFGGGVRRSSCRHQASPRPSGQVSLSPHPSKMKKSGCRLACALLLIRSIDQTADPPALLRVALFANNCTDWSANLARKLGASWQLDPRVVEPHCLPALRTPATLVAARWTLLRLG
jgi:hypothetical protein